MYEVARVGSAEGLSLAAMVSVVRDHGDDPEAVTDDQLLAKQMRYYDDRAPIYEQLIRRLDQGEFTIVKRFFLPDELVNAFADVGLHAVVETTGEYFLYGTAGIPKMP